METVKETRAQLPERAVELLKAPNFGHLGTLMPDGSIQVTPVWVDTDGTHALVNTAAGRQKARNLGSGAQVTLEVSDQENPYSYVEIRGRVGEVTTEGAEAMIHDLHRKYHGSGSYPLPPGQKRLIIKIVPERVGVH
jgi:PPOX class probable F420-dependent enzyme